MRNTSDTEKLLERFDRSLEAEHDWTFIVEGEVVLTKLRAKVVRGFLEYVLARRPQLTVSVRLDNAKEVM